MASLGDLCFLLTIQWFPWIFKHQKMRWGCSSCVHWSISPCLLMGPRGSPHILLVPWHTFFVDLFNIWPWLRAESSKSFGQCQLPSVTWEREQSVLKERTWFAWIWLSLGKLKFFRNTLWASAMVGGGGRSLFGLLWSQSTSLALCSDRHHRCFCWNGKWKEIILQTFPRP